MPLRSQIAVGRSLKAQGGFAPRVQYNDRSGGYTIRSVLMESDSTTHSSRWHHIQYLHIHTHIRAQSRVSLVVS